jgi:hypothetical protein
MLLNFFFNYSYPKKYSGIAELVARQPTELKKKRFEPPTDNRFLLKKIILSKDSKLQ